MQKKLVFEDCGAKGNDTAEATDRILGGNSAQEQEYPWIAAVGHSLQLGTPKIYLLFS